MSDEERARELKADYLYSVYCNGNPISLPTSERHGIYWDGWERVAKRVAAYGAECEARGREQALQGVREAIWPKE